MWFVIVIIIIILIIYLCNNKVEGFNDHYGTLCKSCENKTFNECMQCFNCSFCVDKWGNGKCIGGDVNSGPYNKEKCARIYNGDAFLRAKQDNKNCVMYGPKVNI